MPVKKSNFWHGQHMVFQRRNLLGRILAEGVNEIAPVKLDGTRQGRIRSLCDQVANFIRLEGPVKFFCKNFRRRALVISTFLLLQCAHGAIKRLQKKGFSATISSYHQIDRTEVWPVQFCEWPEVIELNFI
ncbi:hypothetical protein [Geothermobacter hydrogeniphilus]|uniref:hypothetical protein n=1 Tax=Geothermobacter hydrogeniphilus TaxID=1969733 RepID=UPI0018EE1EEF|nr:hypothetical protein [Geothermobacter hydrogeniphilus]